MAPHSPTILIGPLLLDRLALPLPPTAVRFRNVGSHSLVMQFLQHRAAVIALVGDDLLDGTFMDLASRRLRFRQGPVNRIGVAVTGRLQRDSQHSRAPPPGTFTACSALCPRCLRPSFIFVMRASGSAGLIHCSFEPFFFRFRSSRASCSLVGFSIPAASASPFRYSL